jgi:hypothetical protein
MIAQVPVPSADGLLFHAGAIREKYCAAHDQLVRARVELLLAEVVAEQWELSELSR